MKTSKFNLMMTSIVILAAVTSLAAQDTANSSKVSLFNGKDLSGWTFSLRDSAVDPATVFSVKDGIINIKGQPFGYMRTTEKYSDYTLHVEWRWPAEPSNSGIFIHWQAPDAIWPKCIESQLMPGNAGDIVCMNGSDIVERTDKTKAVVKKLSESSEKPAGQWNTMEIVCNGSTIEITVNGKLQNRATGANIDSGSICLQSEGGEVQFRNVYITSAK